MIITRHPGYYTIELLQGPDFRNQLALLKAFPEKRWMPEHRYYHLPDTAGDAVEQLANHLSVKVRDVAVPAAPGQEAEQEQIPEPVFEIALGKNAPGKPFPYQEKGIITGLKMRRFMNGDDPGLGKAQPLTALVATPCGWRQMGSLKHGDAVFGKDGKVYSVTGVYPQGIRECYRVTFSDGAYTDCDADHLWQVRDQNRRRRGNGWITKTTAELIAAGICHKTNPAREATGRQPALKWEIPVADPVLYERKDYVIPPYTLGALIGDGALTAPMVTISLPPEKNQVLERIAEALPPNLKIRVNPHPACPQYAITQSNTTLKNPYKQAVEDLGLAVKSPERFIPAQYLQGSVEQRKELLYGLMDTDGSAVKNRITFHTVSTRLANDVRELVQSLGGIAIVRPYDRTAEGKSLEYQVNIRLPFNPFTLPQKAAHWAPIGRGISRYIATVVRKGMEAQQCISVSAPDRLYLTDSYIVTHNTIQSCLTIASAQANGMSAFPVLIICPASLKENWKREWEMWTGKKAVILSDSIKDTWPVYFNTGMAQAFIVNYESLKKYFVLRMPGKKQRSSEIEMKANINLFRSVIIDEAHRCKDPGTMQTKLALRICAGKEWVILCTGTPVKNRIVDLYPQLAIMGRLQQFGGRAGFMKDYGGKDASAADLNRKMSRVCYFRRDKESVLKDLPDKLRQQIVCEIDTWPEYQQAKNQFMQWLQSNGANAEQITSAMRAEALVRMNKLRAISARGKMEAVKEVIEEVLNAGEKLIVFHSLKEVGQAICKMFPKAVTINGSNTTESRQANVDAFQTDPAVQLIVCNIQAAGVGITLTASSRVLFVEFPWTYADLVQCEDRAHRIGQKNAVMCTYILGKDTVDEQLFAAITRKKDIHQQVTGAEDDMDMSTVDRMLNLFKA